MYDYDFGSTKGFSMRILQSDGTKMASFTGDPVLVQKNISFPCNNFHRFTVPCSFILSLVTPPPPTPHTPPPPSPVMCKTTSGAAIGRK